MADLLMLALVVAAFLAAGAFARACRGLMEPGGNSDGAER